MLLSFQKKRFPFGEAVANSWSSATNDPNGYEYSGSISDIPLAVYENGTAMTSGTLGSLAVGEWAWDYSINRLVVRLSDDSDPSTKSDGYIQFTRFVNIYHAPQNGESIALNLLFSNNDSTTAKVILTIRDYYGKTMFIQSFDVVVTEQIDKLIISGGSRLSVMTDREFLSVVGNLNIEEG